MPALTSPISYADLLEPALAAVVTPQELAQCMREYLTKKAAYEARGVSYGGLTTRLDAPLVDASVVRFQDEHGQWIQGRSEPKIDPNHFRIDLAVHAYAPCPEHGPLGMACDCAKVLTGLREGPANLCTNVFANLVRVGILGVATTVTDTTGAGRALTSAMDGAINQAAGGRIGCAGTGGTAATVADTNMQTQTETQTSVTVNTVSGSGASGTFTVTYTITATADRAYQEVGIKVVTTTNAWNFLVTHDSFSTLNVSSSGTLSVTYTFSNS